MARFNVALAGCGEMSQAWLDYITTREDVDIVALVDIKTENAEDKKRKYSLSCPVFTKLTDALEKCSVNLVIDVTIPEAHFNVVTTALKAGCDVLGEKPMANTLDEAVKMVEIADAAGKSYSVMQNRRYIDFMIAFHDFTKGQTLGNIGALSADFLIGAHFGGFRNLMDSPLVLDMAIHTFDSARYISCTNAVSVYCHEFNPSWSWYKGNANAVCIFEMDNGAVFDYRGSWCTEGFNTSWEADWRAVYEKGSAKCVGNNLSYAKAKEEQGFMRACDVFPIEPKPIELNGHNGCIQNMLDSLIKGVKMQTDCHDNIHSIAMVHSAIESARKGQKVQIIV